MKPDGKVFTLENDDLRLTIVRHGSELTNIYDKKKNRELLWRADPAIWKRHSPVLFPFIAKSYESQFCYEGKIYPTTSHGFARDQDFTPVLCDMDECWYKFTDTPDTYAIYPFHFELEIGHTLSGREITVTWRVTNKDSKDLLFMIGAHPAFIIPEGKSLYDFSFEFNKEGVNAGKYQDGLHYLAPDERGYEVAELQGVLALEDGKVPLRKGFFANTPQTALTYIFDNAQISSAKLLVSGEPYVTVLCDNFPYFGLWCVEKTHPFVCLEPWYGISGTDGFTGELKDRKGINTLGAWETWERKYTIRVE